MKLLWYGFVGMFAVIGLSLALLNGAGVLFGMGLIGFAALLQMLYLILAELRSSRLVSEKNLSVQQRVADNLEWVLFAPEGETRSGEVKR
jgi:hypothetical protein